MSDKLKPYQDPNHEGNSKKYKTNKVCIEKDCENKAGTAWSPLWCLECNVIRMDRISSQLKATKMTEGKSKNMRRIGLWRKTGSMPAFSETLAFLDDETIPTYEVGREDSIEEGFFLTDQELSELHQRIKDLEAEAVDNKLIREDYKEQIEELCDMAWKRVYPDGKVDYQYRVQPIAHLIQLCNELEAEREEIAREVIKDFITWDVKRCLEIDPVYYKDTINGIFQAYWQQKQKEQDDKR